VLVCATPVTTFVVPSAIARAPDVKLPPNVDARTLQLIELIFNFFNK
jgi:hypothetical protein